MRLLVINFDMDRRSPTMAWSHRVVELLAERCESVLVLTTRIGDCAPPHNVTVELIPPRFMGLPRGAGGGLLYNARALGLLRRHRVEACFTHMAMPWVCRLYPALRRAGLPILLWYAHGSVSWRLRLAHRLADRIVTSTPEGFRLPSNKASIIGQGVDTDLFSIQPPEPSRDDLIYVGRVSARKNVDRLIRVFATARRLSPELPLRLRIVGAALTDDDRRYRSRMEGLAQELGVGDRTQFAGYMRQEDIARCYGSAFLHLNLSDTGSMDKTVLEALACGCPALTSNEAFFEFFRDRPEHLAPGALGEDVGEEAVAKQVIGWYEARERADPARFRAMVEGRHDIRSYVDRVARQLEELRRDRSGVRNCGD